MKQGGYASFAEAERASAAFKFPTIELVFQASHYGGRGVELCHSVAWERVGPAWGLGFEGSSWEMGG